MPISKKYVFVVSMDVEPAYEDLFNEVYDTEHVPLLQKVPGVGTVTRLKGEPFAVTIGGERKEAGPPSPVYTAWYEIDDPKVLESAEWADAVEQGRWPDKVRPHTTNRQHACFKVRD